MDEAMLAEVRQANAAYLAGYERRLAAEIVAMLPDREEAWRVLATVDGHVECETAAARTAPAPTAAPRRRLRSGPQARRWRPFRAPGGPERPGLARGGSAARLAAFFQAWARLGGGSQRGENEVALDVARDLVQGPGSAMRTVRQFLRDLFQKLGPLAEGHGLSQREQNLLFFVGKREQRGRHGASSSEAGAATISRTAARSMG